MNQRKLFLGCIADDFTGASDAASFLAGGGLSVELYDGIPKEISKKTPQAVVVALKTRSIPKEDAVRDSLMVYEWLKRKGAKQVYFKYCSTFDSTNEGNIGPVADALLESTNTQFSLLCPSLIVNGRTVKNGRLFVNDIPLEKSYMKNHPITPMWDSKISKLMIKQSKYPVYDVCLKELLDADKLNERIDDISKKTEMFYLVPDYYEEEHADFILKNFGDIPFLTGGSGLLSYLSKKIIDDNMLTKDEVEIETPSENCIILAGSCSVTTLSQIEYYKQCDGKAYKIDPLKLISNEQSIDDVFHQIDESIKNKNTIMIYSSDEIENIRNAQKFGMEKVSNMLEEVMSKAAQYAYQKGITRIIVAGGETSGAVTKGMKFSSYMIDKSIDPGVPILIPKSKRDVRLVLKSGNFGKKDFFEKAIKLTGINYGKK